MSVRSVPSADVVRMPASMLVSDSEPNSMFSGYSGALSMAPKSTPASETLNPPAL
jgi:hypothetical protein